MMIGCQSFNKLSTVSVVLFSGKCPLEVSLHATGDPQGELYVTHASLPDSVTLDNIDNAQCCNITKRICH